MEKIKTIGILRAEYSYLENNPVCGMGGCLGLCQLENGENNIFEWKYIFRGPKNSLYKNGLFSIKIKFPEDYPESPPEIIFKTPIYHLNINSSSKTGEPVGKVYTNSLHYWKNYYTIGKILPEIIVLFYKQNPDCGYDDQKNYEYLNSKEVFEQKIKYFTKKYAYPNNSNTYPEGVDWDFNIK